jgi:hypothetical protein
VNDWNKEVLIVDPRAPVDASDRVLVYLPNDLRVRTTGTYAPRRTISDATTIRIYVSRPHGKGNYQEFDRGRVAIAKIVREDSDG